MPHNMLPERGLGQSGAVWGSSGYFWVVLSYRRSLLGRCVFPRPGILLFLSVRGQPALTRDVFHVDGPTSCDPPYTLLYPPYKAFYPPKYRTHLSEGPPTIPPTATTPW